jgi:hypothetical protein
MKIGVIKIGFSNKEGTSKEEVRLIKIDKIKVNPYQPRKTIEEIKVAGTCTINKNLWTAAAHYSHWE